MTKTPGQIAYEAHVQNRFQEYPSKSEQYWTRESDRNKSSWESAAQAVRAPLVEELNALRIAFAEASQDAGPAFVAHEAFDAARVEIAALRKSNAELVEACRIGIATLHELSDAYNVDVNVTIHELAAAIIATADNIEKSIEAAERSPWTRCADALPTEEKNYIITAKSDGRTYATWAIWWVEGNKFMGFADFMVIAWMPFPEPLKE